MQMFIGVACQILILLSPKAVINLSVDAFYCNKNNLRTYMKFLTIKTEYIKGYKTLALYNADNSESKGFGLYRDGMLKKRRGLSINTINTYLISVAHFLDYLHAYLMASDDRFLTEDLISEALDNWDEYLVEGQNSEEEIINNVCKILPSRNVSPSTSVLYHAGLRHFLIASEKLNKAYQSYYKNGLMKETVIPSGVDLKQQPYESKIQPHQRAALISNSVLAGVIKGGPVLAKTAMFPTVSSGADTRSYKDFPYDKVHSLLQAMNNDRDRALYALIAASGCRTHEALRILGTDIDIKNRKVKLADPETRINKGYYHSFTTAERKVISIWKGRQTEVTFLMEPFKSLFFKYAASYYKNEKPQDGKPLVY